MHKAFVSHYDSENGYDITKKDLIPQNFDHSNPSADDTNQITQSKFAFLMPGTGFSHQVCCLSNAQPSGITAQPLPQQSHVGSQVVSSFQSSAPAKGKPNTVITQHTTTDGKLQNEARKLATTTASAPVNRLWNFASWENNNWP